MLNTDQLKAFAKLYLARKKIREKDNEITAKLLQMEQGLIDHMIDEEMNKVSLKGGITVSIDEKIWPKILVEDEWGNKDKQRVVEALRKAGLFEYITAETYNNQSLGKYLRDLDKAEEKLPPELEGIIKPNLKSKIKVTKPK